VSVSHPTFGGGSVSCGVKGVSKNTKGRTSASRARTSVFPAKTQHTHKRKREVRGLWIRRGHAHWLKAPSVAPSTMCLQVANKKATLQVQWVGMCRALMKQTCVFPPHRPRQAKWCFSISRPFRVKATGPHGLRHVGSDLQPSERQGRSKRPYSSESSSQIRASEQEPRGPCTQLPIPAVLAPRLACKRAQPLHKTPKQLSSKWHCLRPPGIHPAAIAVETQSPQNGPKRQGCKRVHEAPFALRLLQAGVI
jgi:hypothetical protein